jgi:hypothetical protein
MTGSDHEEWNEGMPLAVRRYGIDQKKCKVLLCGVAMHRQVCGLMCRGSYRHDGRNKRMREQTEEQTITERRKEQKKEKERKKEIFNSLTPHFGFPERKNFLSTQELVSCTFLFQIRISCGQAFLISLSHSFFSMDHTLIFHSGI